MSNENFYDNQGFDQSMDVSASTRKFQQSIVIKQDPNKSGILFFLSQAEQEMQRQPQQRSTNTIRPSYDEGGYTSWLHRS